MNNPGLASTNLGLTSGQRMQESESSEQPVASKFLNLLKSELQMNKHQRHIERELHLKRVQNLRKELEYLKATEWYYQPVDKNLDQSYRH